MSDFFDITHSTHYQYAAPVTFSEHRVLFRPRGSHDMRVLATDMTVTPTPVAIRLIQDAYSNSVALVQPQSPATQLHVLCSFSVEHTGTRPVESTRSTTEMFPVDYAEEDRLVLAHYLRPYYDDPEGALHAWASGFVASLTGDGDARDARDLLLAMTQFIRDSLLYQPRSDEGVQTPFETLQAQSGTCRDFATLMIEAVRQLGYAARFVSGYLYAPPPEDAGAGELATPGATHAWLEVYLPWSGWMPYDPTNNLVAGTDLIRVGVARHASLASPVSGAWQGRPEDYLGMTVDVQVHKRL